MIRINYNILLSLFNILYRICTVVINKAAYCYFENKRKQIGNPCYFYSHSYHEIAGGGFLLE